jgi:hypothetical protein
MKRGRAGRQLGRDTTQVNFLKLGRADRKMGRDTTQVNFLKWDEQTVKWDETQC